MSIYCGSVCVDTRLSVDKMRIPRETNHATFFANGHAMMTKRAHIEFFARSMLLIATWCSLQMVHEDLKLDASALLAAFSFEDEDGKREKVGPWPEGPGEENNDYRADVAQRWAEETYKAEMMIPAIALAGGRDIVNIIREGGLKKGGSLRAPKEYKQRMIPCKHCGGLNRAQNGSKH